MPIILATERKHWRTRLLVTSLYLLATFGAVTMVYPFLIMLSGSVKSHIDFDTFEAVPAYLTDEALLYRKFLRARYQANIWRYQFTAKTNIRQFEDAPYDPHDRSQHALDLFEFLESRDYPPYFLSLGQQREHGVQPRMLRQWRAFLSDRFDGDTDRLNRTLGLTIKGWEQVAIPEVEMFSRRSRFAGHDYEELYRREFRPHVPIHEFYPIHLEGLFCDWLRNRYRRDITTFNRKTGTDFEHFYEIPLARSRPTNGPLEADWDRFVRDNVNLIFVQLASTAEPAWRSFLNARGRPPVPLPARLDEAGPYAAEWKAFVEEGECLDAVLIDGIDHRYRGFLEQKYGSIAALNVAHEANWTSLDEVPLDVSAYDSLLLRRHKGAITWEFFSRNYRQAFDFLAVRGNAFRITFVYCSLNVLLHLIVNPLAAYALSRYRMRYGHFILVFCLLTMAFPAEVGSIPRFLLIRELGLLNTLWALLLPGAAHGFSIFILKGFFDGLPQELYEAATVEGAPERWMFWNVTLALTKPILAVTAFGAFTAAYGSFMYALVICPDKKMWTISVWLYQFQQEVAEPVAFAGLVLASLPVLLAFIIAQRFILLGIVLPMEK
jgi:multiple sugar transport system permease protein